MPQTTEKRKEGPLPRGAYTKIARRLRPKVSAVHVRLVALGVRESPRVSRAIDVFVAALERRQQKQVE